MFFTLKCSIPDSLLSSFEDLGTIYFSRYLDQPDWNLSTFSTRYRPCNKKNQACK